MGRRPGCLAVMAARFIRDRSGATAIEYAMIAAGIAGVVVTTVYALGGTVQNRFYEKITEAMK